MIFTARNLHLEWIFHGYASHNQRVISMLVSPKLDSWHGRTWSLPTAGAWYQTKTMVIDTEFGLSQGLFKINTNYKHNNNNNNDNTSNDNNNNDNNSNDNNNNNSNNKHFCPCRSDI